MQPIRQPFFLLTADDLMSREVVTIRQEMSLPAAARLLSRAQISGAPVVDGAGVCVGVLSATDFLCLAEGEGRPRVAAGTPSRCICADWQVMELHDLPADEVRQHMTADPVTVCAHTPVGELARLMLDAHIHRIIVVDALGRPVGVVSSTDIIAAVAQTEAARPEVGAAAHG